MLDPISSIFVIRIHTRKNVGTVPRNCLAIHLELRNLNPWPLDLKLAHQLLRPLGILTLILFFFLCLLVLKLWAHVGQAVGRMDRQERCCDLLGWLRNS